MNEERLLQEARLLTKFGDHKHICLPHMQLKKSQIASVLSQLLNAFDFLHEKHTHYVEMVMSMTASSCSCSLKSIGSITATGMVGKIDKYVSHRYRMKYWMN